MTERTPFTRFFVLGPIRAERDGRPLALGGPKQRILLACLLLAPNRVVSIDRLLECLWNDPTQERSVATLHVYVAKLRKVIGHASSTGAPLLETLRPGYRIVVDETSLDLLAFASLVQQARVDLADANLGAASGSFREALALTGGGLLPDLIDEGFVRQEAALFQRTALTATTDAYTCELRRGRHREILGDLERLVSEHPLDEQLCGLLMLALYRTGHQVDALEAFRRIRDTLAEELGVDPSPELRGLELKVLNHDDRLAAHDTGPALREVSSTVVRGSKAMPTASLLLDGVHIPLTHGITTIGRLRDRTVVIADEDASRHHAEIRRTAAGFRLVDVGSTNGTRVNDQRVVEHPLTVGDRIEIGTTILVFQI